MVCLSETNLFDIENSYQTAGIRGGSGGCSKPGWKTKGSSLNIQTRKECE